MFEVEEISKEEMEDLELRKAEMAADPASGSRSGSQGSEAGNEQ